MEVSLFGEAFQEFRHLLVKDEIVVVSGPLRYDDFVGAWSVNVKNVLHIDRVIESRAKSMLLRLAPNGHGDQLLMKLHAAIDEAARCAVTLQGRELRGCRAVLRRQRESEAPTRRRVVRAPKPGTARQAERTPRQ
jgi:hypothetical protein